MFGNVLVGVDGSANSRDAIALAFQLTDPSGRITLVHVRSGASRPSTAVTPGLGRNEAVASEELLERERAATGVAAELASVVATGPGRGLHETAERLGADLIVVGSCSRGLLGRVFTGDDARAALNGAACAVAVAARCYAAHTAPFATVGVGYDESAESEAALATAREIAGADGAEVHVLQVVTSPADALSTIVGAPIDNMRDEAIARLAALSNVVGQAVYGMPGEELAIFSDEVDLLVVGSRSFGSVKRLVLGSTSHYLERHARCSLLVLPRTTVTSATDNAVTDGASFIRSDQPSVV
jgi:nucleotide-binding universal stress UspA family protein